MEPRLTSYVRPPALRRPRANDFLGGPINAFRVRLSRRCLSFPSLLTTRPVTFKGQYQLVNVDCPQGELSAEVLDKDGQVVAPFTAANCRPIACDKTLAAVTWEGDADLSAVSGKPVRFRFHLKNGSLYAFWVSFLPVA